MSSAVRQFFLRPTWGLIGVSAMLVATTAIAAKYVYLYVDWSTTSRHQVEWMNTDAPRICEEIRSICAAEVKSAEPEKNEKNRSDPSGFAWDLYADNPIEIACQKRHNYESLACHTGKPEPFVVYLKWKQSRDAEVGLYLTIVLVQLFVFFAVRRFYAINHLGWQRVSGVLAVSAGLVFAYGVLTTSNISKDPANLASLGIATVLVGLAVAAVPAMLRDAYGWFRDGFARQQQHPLRPAESPKIAQRHEKLPLKWSSILPVLKCCAVVVVIGFLVMLRPESTLKALAMGFAQVAVAAIIWGIYKAMKRK